ncbi:hypothetical protein GQ43DRAFT_370259 [Delitschia confertaspora ATCC 74209]|uniref:Uncharacterized protein n=1 Tax=Delitschia confertaspora ATCC 74209 TaxID=1513339 RepID=A0A9P4JLX5_9PLEO|nr:hypothetical protein GQ43DRAFT_370259 [Delitschia confertaspora ATCC 74209]
MAPTRPLFPATKSVSFRTPLEEEIKTVKYTMAHSDIEAPSSEEPSESSDQSSSEQSSSSAFSSLEGSPRPREPRTGEKRDSSSSEEESDDSCPETPVAGRRKRSRDWRWTLGPLEKSSGVLQSGEDSE